MSKLESNPALTDPRWRGLYLAAAAGAGLSALLIPLQVLVLVAWPPPFGGTVVEWFAQYARNPLLGLLNQDVLMMVEQVLLIAIIPALYVATHRSSESLLLLGTICWLMGAALFIASNTAFEMLSLSTAYAAATTEAQRSVYLAAGQGMLASYFNQGTAFTLGYLLSSTAGVFVGLATRRHPVFGRATARALLAGNLLGFGLFVPGIGIALAVLSVVILWIWYALVARTFLRLGRESVRAVREGAAGTLAVPATSSFGLS